MDSLAFPQLMSRFASATIQPASVAAPGSRACPRCRLIVRGPDSRSLLMAIVLAIPGVPATVSGQVQVGDRVRVHVGDESGWHVGSAQSIDAGSILIRGGGEVRAFLLAEVDSVEVSLGVSHLAKPGAIVGALLGGIAGATASAQFCIHSGFCYVGTTVLFSAVAAGGGALLGVLFRRESWAGVPVGRPGFSEW